MSSVSVADNKTKAATEMPPELVNELRKMRRDPAEFQVLGVVHCRFCSEKKSIEIAHANSPSCGAWCPTHGFIYFDSVRVPPLGTVEQRRPRRRAA